MTKHSKAGSLAEGALSPSRVTTVAGDDLVEALVEDATSAPSMHNAQPWTFRFLRESGVLQLRGDPDRTMPRTDPAPHRALHLGCGAALFNLRVAAAHAGREALTTLLPDPADPWLLAEVTVAGSRPGDDDLASLHPAIHRRHTSRFPFTDEEVPEAILDGLRGAALLEGARLYVPDAWHVRSVLDLVHDAEGREAADAAARAETARWTEAGTGTGSGTGTEAGTGTGTGTGVGTGAGTRDGKVEDARQDGIPAYAFGPRQHDVTVPVRDFAGRRLLPGRGTAAFEKQPCLALLGTVHDRPADWLRAGQALERILLQATLDGLVTSLTSQALEWPDLRWAVRDPSSAMGHVHMVIRLGYGPTGPATPRRPVPDVLDIV